ncbi:response regulator [Azoarcus sp. DD4]|uniref:response regulator n=1 Tax=Azoarcus sp. DD4 TaxID=2027405 RepID=UPI001F117284|nr:response regulator [Azoarcus sp. DD4]
MSAIPSTCPTPFDTRTESKNMIKTVLTVDDSAAIRSVVGVVLQSAGYAVSSAVDGEDGLARARSQRADLVITDLNMPRMDGLALVRALRAEPAYRKVPILILTTESAPEMRERGREAGATGWLVKPFDPERLLEVVRRVLG